MNSKISKDDIRIIVLNSKEIKQAISYISKIPYSPKSNVVNNRTIKQHIKDTITGKLGEMAFYKYLNRLDEFNDRNSKQIKEYLSTGKKGDGGIDIDKTNIDIKTSIYKRAKSGNKYSWFYVAKREWSPLKIYVKAYFFDDEFDFDNLLDNKTLKVRIAGFCSGKKFTEKSAPAKNAAMGFLLKYLNKISGLWFQTIKIPSIEIKILPTYIEKNKK